MRLLRAERDPLVVVPEERCAELEPRQDANLQRSRERQGRRGIDEQIDDIRTHESTSSGGRPRWTS